MSRPRPPARPIGKSRRRGSWAGTLCASVGALVVIAAMFAAGVYADRYWARTARVPTSRHEERTGKTPRTTSDTRTPDATTSQPALTFYQELTAPLGAPPPPIRPAPKPAAVTKTPASPTTEPSPAAKPTTRVGEHAGPSVDGVAGGGNAVERTERPASGETRYTVQIAAYTERAPAEELRDRMVASGHDAYVVENDAPSGARYRVRVGSYSTRATAAEAADRLRAERHVGTYVTTR